ncbi:hypothetical protein [Actinoplanes sp. NPDC051494]|uniref:hypothetical protein n=1 Tax=Actinoplanes sp. NPDC051494 TaxID=3363907 RepID=UPI00378B21EE
MAGITRDPHLGADLDDVGDDVREWLAAVFRDNGELDARRLDSLVFERRRDLARLTVRALAREAAPEVGALWALEVRTVEPGDDEPAGAVRVGVETILSLDRAGVIAEAAEGVQGYIARERQAIWPACPVHGRGLHPAVRSGAAVWICRDGDHTVAPIIGE